jgi:low affinity Fe/Cu permease
MTGPSGTPSRWAVRARKERIEPRTRSLSTTGRMLYRIDHYSSLPGTAVVAGLVLVAGLAAGGALRFSTRWESGFSVGMGVITLMMVFVIQHTQAREQIATQRKLDELLRALPEAESGLMLLEEASEDEMRDVEMGQRSVKSDAVQAAGDPTDGWAPATPGR